MLQAGIDDPNIFELLGLFQDKFGPDRVSDITVRIILPDILAYTARVAARAGAPTKVVEIDGVEATVPFDEHTDEWFLLLPKSILTNLPVAHSYDDISSVCSHNEALRDYVNDLLGSEWREVLKDMSKPEVKDLLVAEPKMVREILSEYKATPADAYDFQLDPDMEIGWHDAGRAAVRRNPLDLSLPDPATVNREDVVAVVHTICTQYKHLIENQGVWEVLWDSNERPRIERVAQRLFLTVADAYCRSSNLALTPEANAGSGPVDFKMSEGYEGTVLVELKRSGNSQLEHGYEKQLELYKTAEKTTDAFFVILDFGDRSDDLIAKLVRKAKRAKSAGRPFSHVVVVDATRKASASKRR